MRAVAKYALVAVLEKENSEIQMAAGDVIIAATAGNTTTGRIMTDG